MSKYIIIKRDIHRPGPKKITPADKEEVQFIDAISRDPMVKLYLQEEECTELYMDKATNILHFPIMLVSIQGVPFLLKPGENLVPKTVYDFIQQNKQDCLDAIERNKRYNKQDLGKDLQRNA